MVRRTRSFIQDNYAETDPATGRKFLTFEDGTRSYFPVREPRTVKFKIEDKNSDDQYACLYADDVVNAINNLNLPRYGLGNYISKRPMNRLLKMRQNLTRPLKSRQTPYGFLPYKSF